MPSIDRQLKSTQQNGTKAVHLQNHEEQFVTKDVSRETFEYTRV
jgi:hypothetical protein